MKEVFFDFTEKFTRQVASSIWSQLQKDDPDRSYWEPLTEDEAKQIGANRCAEIRSHNRKYYSEVEDFVTYIYSEVNWADVTAKVNAMYRRAYEIRGY